MTNEAATLSLAILCIADEEMSDIKNQADHLKRRILGAGHRLFAVCTVRDQKEAVCAQVQSLIDTRQVDAILAIDRSIFAHGEKPPVISLSDTRDDGPTYSLVLKDGRFGYVGIIDIKAARASFT
jgi:hypothetical protein